MRRAATVAAVLALGVALGACGDDGGDVASTTTVTVSTATQQPPGGGGAFDPQRIYAERSPGVVTILSLFGDDGLRSPSGGGGGGQGSGFVVSGDGEVVTNAHVVTQGEGGGVGTARQVFVRFADGNQVDAEIVGVDPDGDVALLRVDPAGLDLRPLELARLDTVVVGEPVAAIGSPYGEPQSLSIGVVSALNRLIQSLTGFAISGAIQTDAAINSGNSGGPLLDAEGRVIGINSQIKSASGAGSGVGFAVSADSVLHSLEQLREDGEVEYAFLGVSTVPVYPQLADRFDLGVDEGAWVQTVEDGGPAARAGIRAGDRGEARFQARPYRLGGDVIVAVGGDPVGRDTDVARLLLGHEPGEEIEIRVRRGDEEREVTVTLGERPAATGP